MIFPCRHHGTTTKLQVKVEIFYLHRANLLFQVTSSWQTSQNISTSSPISTSKATYRNGSISTCSFNQVERWEWFQGPLEYNKGKTEPKEGPSVSNVKKVGLGFQNNFRIWLKPSSRMTTIKTNMKIRFHGGCPR